MTGRSVRICQVVSGCRALLGIGLLAWPARLASVASFGDRPPASWLVRLLGARMLAQSAVELAHTNRTVVRLGAAADALHALSMLAVAGRRSGYRHAALVSAAIAAASAAAGLATRASSGPATRVISGRAG